MSDKKVEPVPYKADKLGYFQALAMFGGAALGIKHKTPAAWIGHGIGLGLVNLVGAHATSKDPLNCYVQFGVNIFYIYGTCMDMYIHPKHARLMAPFAALSALNLARCMVVFYKRDEPVRRI